MEVLFTVWEGLVGSNDFSFKWLELLGYDIADLECESGISVPRFPHKVTLLPSFRSLILFLSVLLKHFPRETDLQKRRHSMNPQSSPAIVSSVGHIELDRCAGVTVKALEMLFFVSVL